MERRWGVVSIVVVTGCLATQPPHFHTLDMTASGQVRPPCRIVVERLRPAEPLARRELLIQKSPTEIEYYARDRWAADLGELVAQKLEAEFGPAPDGAKILVISGAILSFGQADLPGGGAEAHIKLKLAYRPAGVSRYVKPLLEKTHEVRFETKAATPAAVVKGLSEGLERVAADIAADASGL